MKIAITVSGKEARETGRCAIVEGLAAISLKGCSLVVGVFIAARRKRKERSGREFKIA